jgi:hypothetical protein
MATAAESAGALPLELPVGHPEALTEKQQVAAPDLDTVSTHATTNNTSTFSSGSDNDTPSAEEKEAAPDAEEKENQAETTETKSSKKSSKGERRHRRSSRPGTNTMLYTKAMYKRRFCAHYPDTSQCKRGSQCAFAHSREEFRGSLLPADEEHEGEHSDDFYMNRYKTLWCPVGIQHNWQNCVYAHNYLDIRRSPAIGYGPRQCPHWDKSNNKTTYADRCPNGVRCPYAHGAKEQLYHPAYFKTVVCWDMMSPEGCPRSHLCAFHHNKDECRVEITKDMEYDYTRPLEDKQVSMLQKDFNTPPPIGDVETSKAAPQQKKDAAPPPAPPAPQAAAGKAPQMPQVPMMVMMMPSAMPHAVPAMHGMHGMPIAMHPQMVGSATPNNMGTKVAPRVIMMPMPGMPQVAGAGMVRPVDGAMLPEAVGPAVMQMQLPMDPTQYGGSPYGSPGAAAYPTAQQSFHPNPDSSPSFREVCSPSYQSSEAYERYVKDIMNAEGDDFQFDWPTNRSKTYGQGSGEAMMVDKTRMPSSEVSTDEGAWSYASEPSTNSGRWFNQSGLVMSP